MKRAAFTWMELMVVIAVLVLLVGILVPSLGHARVVARRSTCLANVRQLNQAFQKYVSEWNSSVCYGADVPSLHNNYWTSPLAAYLNNAEKVRQCPEAVVLNSKMFATGTSTSPWNQPDMALSRLQTGAYSINGWLYTAHFPAAVWMGEEASFLDAETRSDAIHPLPTIIDSESFYKLPITRNAENIPTFADGIWSETFPAPYDSVPDDLHDGGGPSIGYHLSQLCIARHGKAVNVSFLDGHAETVELRNLWTLQWQAQWATPALLPAIH